MLTKSKRVKIPHSFIEKNVHFKHVVIFSYEVQLFTHHGLTVMVVFHKEKSNRLNR